MKQISIQELHQDTDQWVRLAASREQIIITEGGQPIAALTPLKPSKSPKRLPDREAKINRRSRIEVDSADYIFEREE